MHSSKRLGTESNWGNRHCPSSAILAPIRIPSELLTTVEVGSSNSFLGRQNNHKTKTAPRTLILILCLASVFRRAAMFFIHATSLNHFNPLSFVSGLVVVVVHGFCLCSRQIVIAQERSIQFYGEAFGFFRTKVKI